MDMSKYEKYKEMGLSEERYLQMMHVLGNNEELMDGTIEYWGVEKLNKGYDIFDFDGTGMLEIAEIGVTDAFNGSDIRATEAAIEDGIQIIPVTELPENFDRRYLGWLDTPENRKAIEEYCKEDNYFCNGNSLR